MVLHFSMLIQSPSTPGKWARLQRHLQKAMPSKKQRRRRATAMAYHKPRSPRHLQSAAVHLCRAILTVQPRNPCSVRAGQQQLAAPSVFHR
jgi:hypothetical protein